ncbi:hypothetical protein V8F33_009207 [Rhypophila sp. PSN 637]
MLNSKITTLLCLLASGFHAVAAAPREIHQGADATRSNRDLNDRDIHIAENVLVVPDRSGNVRVSKKVSSSLNSIHIDLEFGATCANVGEECEKDSDCCPNWTACPNGYCRKL